MNRDSKKLNYRVEIADKPEQMRQWEDFLKLRGAAGGAGAVCCGGGCGLNCVLPVLAGFNDIHQSTEWAKFQKASGKRNKSWLLLVKSPAGEIVGGALIYQQVISQKLSWLFSPRGPVGNLADELFWLSLNQAVEKLANAEKAVFWRVETAVPLKEGERVWRIQKKIGFRKAHAHHQPENTLKINLKLSEAELLAQMKPKGRYNIKLAEKKGVQVRSGESNDDVLKFYSLLQQTTQRDGFSGHDLGFYQTMIKELGKEKVQLYLAEYDGEVIAGIIVTFFGNEAIYYFGASGNQHRNLMAPYLLQWVAILEAKKGGLQWYDFLGVAPENATNKHAWAGVTDFKLKFGGERVDYLPATEKVYAPIWYWLILAVKWLKRWKR